MRGVLLSGNLYGPTKPATSEVVGELVPDLSPRRAARHRCGLQGHAGRRTSDEPTDCPELRKSVPRRPVNGQFAQRQLVPLRHTATVEPPLAAASPPYQAMPLGIMRVFATVVTKFESPVQRGTTWTCGVLLTLLPGRPRLMPTLTPPASTGPSALAPSVTGRPQLGGLGAVRSAGRPPRGRAAPSGDRSRTGDVEDGEARRAAVQDVDLLVWQAGLENAGEHRRRGLGRSAAPSRPRTLSAIRSRAARASRRVGAAPLPAELLDELRTGMSRSTSPPRVHPDGVVGDVVVADDEDVGQLLELGGADALAERIGRVNDIGR